MESQLKPVLLKFKSTDRAQYRSDKYKEPRHEKMMPKLTEMRTKRTETELTESGTPGSYVVEDLEEEQWRFMGEDRDDEVSKNYMDDNENVHSGLCNEASNKGKDRMQKS